MRPEETQHVIIAGPPRTGSTKLVQLLSSQRDLFITNEFGTYNHWDKSDKWMMFKKAKDFSSFRANSRIFEDRCFNLDSVWYKIVSNKMSGRDVFCWLQKNIPAEIYGDKCPFSYLSNLPKLSRKFSNAKFIITMRDGRDVVASQVRNYKNRKSSYANWMYPTVEEAEHVWLKCAKMVVEHFNKDRVFLWKYEDGLFAELGKFIGIKVIDNNDMFKVRSSWR